MKKYLLLLTAAFFFFYPVFSQTLYSNTTQTGVRYNPGAGAAGTPVIAFDDVQIPSTQVMGTDSIAITNVKFGIRRFALAPAATIKFYYTVVEDTATIFDNLIRIPPVLIGSVDLPANGASSVLNIVSLGDSVNKLFSILTDTGSLYAGYQTFFLGLSIASNDPSGLNGWRLTTPGAPQSYNDNVLWVYDVDNPQTTRATFFGNPPTNPSATFYLQVFGGGFITLPVSLTTFTARRNNGTNQLNWSTQQELNAKYFVVERGSDGRNFTSIGEVAATGNSNTVHDYSFTDLNPGKGDNYYRLRTIDKDNSSKLSDTRRIRNIGIADVRIYPNPAPDNLNLAINADKASIGQLSITDISGKIIYTRSVNLPAGNTILTIPTNNIAAGTYLMKIQLNDDIILKKFNKQ